MSREPFIVLPGKNAILADAWAKHTAAQRSEGRKAKAEPVPEPSKKNAKPLRAKGGKPSKVKP